MMNKTVCFTGHRAIPDEIYPTLCALLDRELEKQIENGARIFRAGGALGFDTLAALCVLSARVRHPEIRLELILPSPDQAQRWDPRDRAIYKEILARADSHRYVGQSYFPGVLQLRNRALVQNSDVCIAYLCNSKGGGTAYTASLALKAGIELINLNDLLP